MEIREDDLSGPEIAGLLQLHLTGMHEHSPPESVHAFGADRLKDADVTFWTAWDGRALLGCGALKELDSGHGEIKSMRTAPDHLRKGVGAAILTHLMAVATERNYRWLSLETGSGQAFEPAHALYRRFGFVECGPFADYRPDPFSRFMQRSL